MNDKVLKYLYEIKIAIGEIDSLYNIHKIFFESENPATVIFIE
jgi:hypothetical protein